MPVSTTPARVSVVVPNARALNASQLQAIYTGAKAANVRHAVLHVNWSEVQTAANAALQFGGLTAALTAAAAAQVKLTLVLTGPVPSFAVNKATLAADFANFARGVANWAKTSPNTVVEYQVWHWPNVSESWGAAPDPAEYTALLKAAHAALKSVNPSVAVVFGSLAPVTTSRTTGRQPARAGRGRASAPLLPEQVSPNAFLTAAYTAGARGFFDAVGYTPVSIATPQQSKPPAPSGDSIKQSDDLRAVMTSRNDAAKKLHWTVGYDTDTGKFSGQQQALYLDTLRWLAQTRRDHVAALNVYTYRDDA